MRIVALLLALVAAAAASQAPEFAQQYRQRLGGAIDELHRIIQNFDEDSARSGYTQSQALTVMADNNEQLVRDQARRMAESIVRYTRLKDQQQAFANAGPFMRVAVFIQGYDPGVAAATAGSFEPAVPTTPEGFGFAAIGFAVVYLLLRLIGLLFRRRRGHHRHHRRDDDDFAHESRG